MNLTQDVSDATSAALIRATRSWPCNKRMHLLVGAESSGTTAVAHLLFVDDPSVRFLEEGKNPWVWGAYQDVYRGLKQIRDYPRLQLYDAIKVPGFAAIIPQFREAFPNASVAYLVRDPRDFVASAIRTWKVHTVEELASVSWVREDWLSIPATDPVERLAIRWRTYLRSAAQAGDVMFVRYEDFCADKVRVIRELAGFFGTRFDAERVARLANVQLSHNSVRAYSPFGPGSWQNGPLAQEHVACIESLCAAEMSAWGYEPSVFEGGTE